MDKNDLKLLRETLPKWAVREISKRLGFSKAYIYKVLDGDSYNSKIIDEAITIVKENNDKMLQQKRAISQLT
jgi:hypothetical protein